MLIFASRVLNLYREAYSKHPREIWVLTWVTLINRMGTMVLPFLAVYLKTVMGYSLQEAGVLASAFGFGSLGGALLGGWVSDRYGPRLVIILSLTLGGLCFIGLQFAESFQSLFIMIFLAALFGEAYRPAMSAAAGSFVSKMETGRTMALLRLAINVGMSLAPALGGLVAATIGYHWLFWIDGITCVGAAFFFYFNSRKWNIPIVTRKTPAQGASLPPFRNWAYLWFLLATFFIGFIFLQWFHTVPVFIKSEWGFDERYIGMLLGFASILVAIFEMPLVHLIEQKKKTELVILIGIGLLGGSYLIFLLPQALAICFLAVFFWTMGEILYLPFNNALALNMSPADRRGQYMSGYFMTWSVANICGPLVGFAIIEAQGYSFFWNMLFVVGIVSILITVLLFRRNVTHMT